MMTRQGNINTIAKDDNSLLKVISKELLTGRLSIFYENENKRNVQDVIFIEKGNVIGIKSLERYSLRELLLYAGRITKQQLAEATEEAKASTGAKTPEQVLMEKGIVTREVIIHSIATLIRGCVQRILTKPYGLYIFHQCDQLKGVKAMTRMNINQVILDYCRATKIVDQAVQSDIERKTYAVKGGIDEVKKRFHLTEKEWKVLFSIGSQRAISEVLAESNIELSELNRIIYTLSMIGVIDEVVQEEADVSSAGYDTSASYSPDVSSNQVSEQQQVGEDETAEEEVKDYKGKILVVDDSKTIQKMVQIALKEVPYELIMADDGFMALEKAQQSKPNLVILDVIMPKLDGYKTCVQLKKIFSPDKIPVIMLTARDGTFDKIKGRLAGATMYIAKPFEPEELKSAVEKHIVSF